MPCFDFDGDDLLDTSCHHRHLEPLIFSRVTDANTSLFILLMINESFLTNHLIYLVRCSTHN